MASLMSIECLKVILIIYGSKIPEYYSYEKEDGFKALRYVISLMGIINYLGLPHNGAGFFHMLGNKYSL
jgi:hypothetical protein